MRTAYKVVWANILCPVQIANFRASYKPIRRILKSLQLKFIDFWLANFENNTFSTFT